VLVGGWVRVGIGEGAHVNEGCGDDDAGAEVLCDEEGGFRDTHRL
jgi:hypothetical protein